MPLKTASALLLLPLLVACASVKYNSHVGSDGATGYLRTYYASDKTKVNKLSDGTGIEHCKVQGSDVLCRDLNIVLLPEVAGKAEEQPLLAPVSVPVEAVKEKSVPAAKKNPAKK